MAASHATHEIACSQATAVSMRGFVFSHDAVFFVVCCFCFVFVFLLYGYEQDRECMLLPSSCVNKRLLTAQMLIIVVLTFALWKCGLLQHRFATSSPSMVLHMWTSLCLPTLVLPMRHVNILVFANLCFVQPCCPTSQSHLDVYPISDSYHNVAPRFLSGCRA